MALDVATLLAGLSKTGADPEARSRCFPLVIAILASLLWLPGMTAAPQQPTPLPAQLQTPSTTAPFQRSPPGRKQPSTPSNTAAPRSPLTRPQKSSAPSKADPSQQSAPSPQQTSHSNEAVHAEGPSHDSGLPLMGLLGALVGAFISWIASSWTASKAHRLTTLREQKSYEHRKMAFREMLQVEINQNLEMLKWDQTFTKVQLTGRACPAWSTAVWESGVALWPDILSDERLMDLQLFFIELLSLTSTRASLTSAVLHSSEEPLQRITLASQAVVLAERVLRRGNRLRSLGTTQGENTGMGRGRG